MEKSQRHNAGYKVDMRRATCVERDDLLHVVFAAKFKIAMTDIAGGWELALIPVLFSLHVVHRRLDELSGIHIDLPQVKLSTSSSNYLRVCNHHSHWSPLQVAS